MSMDFISDLLDALKRVLEPDLEKLKEVLILSGMPTKTENLRYLSFNHHPILLNRRRCQFSAVAVLNNRRAMTWRLRGYRKRISQLIFHTRWTRNPLDFFLNNLRCDSRLMELLATSSCNYTLLGILQEGTSAANPVASTGYRWVRPVVAVPGLHGESLQVVESFENDNEIRQIQILGIPVYWKIGAVSPSCTLPRP